MAFNLSPFFVLAQKAGFEPALRLSHTTPLAGEPLEPLGYFCMARTVSLRCYNTIAYFSALVKAFYVKIKKFVPFLLFYTCVEQLLRLFYASIFIFKQGKSGKEL